MTFQLLLVATLVGFAIFLLRFGGIGRTRKALILVVVVAMLVFAIRPEWSTTAARLVGISRGVDLLFYVSHLALLFCAFITFLKLKKMELRMTKLVRQLALEPGSAERQSLLEANRSADGDETSPALGAP